MRPCFDPAPDPPLKVQASRRHVAGRRDAPTVGGFAVLLFIQVRWLHLTSVDRGAPYRYVGCLKETNVTDYKVKLQGSQISNDGHTVRLMTTTESGEPISLLFSHEDNEFLLAALAQAASASGQIRHNDPTLKKVLPCEWWEVNPHPEKDGLLLSFRMPGGMEMTFHLPQLAALRFEEVVATLLGLRTLPQTQGPSH